MIRIIFGLILAVEIFALSNRGGGPLLSHLFLTGAVFLIVCVVLLFRAKLRFCFKLPQIGYLGFLTFFLLSFLFALTPQYGLAEILLFVNAGILFFIISSFKISEKELNLFSIGLIALAVADTLIGYFIYTQTPFPRFTGTFIDLKEPYTSFGNDFGNFLLLILPLSIWQFFKKHERITTTMLFGLSAAILFSGFLLSFSRGAWLSFLVVGIIIIIWAFFYRKNTHLSISKPNFALRCAILIILAAILVNGLQLTRSLNFQITPLLLKAGFQADEGNASITERLGFWNGALKLIKEKPFEGTGVLSFKYLYPRYQQKFGVNWDHPHNIFLKIGVENGSPAVIFFAIFLIGAAWMILRFLRRNPWHPVLFFSFGSLGAFGHNLVDYNFIVANFTLFIVFIAIALASARSQVIQLPVCLIGKQIIHILSVASFFLVLLGLHEGFYNIDFKRGRAALAADNLNAAVAQLESAQKLFFKRDLTNYLAFAYRKKYEETKSEEWRIKEIDLLEVSSVFDASLVSRQSELMAQQRKWDQAENYAMAALRMDPQNHLKYYYQVLEVLKKQKKTMSPEFKNLHEQTLALLEQYKTILSYNGKFTILTDNPLYASKLYDFFNMKKEKEEIDKIWLEELIKFTVKYSHAKTRPQTSDI